MVDTKQLGTYVHLIVKVRRNFSNQNVSPGCCALSYEIVVINMDQDFAALANLFM